MATITLYESNAGTLYAYASAGDQAYYWHSLEHLDTRLRDDAQAFEDEPYDFCRDGNVCIPDPDDMSARRWLAGPDYPDYWDVDEADCIKQTIGTCNAVAEWADGVITVGDECMPHAAALRYLFGDEWEAAHPYAASDYTADELTALANS